MKDFLQRNIALLTGLAIASIVLAVILGILLYGARELQIETLKRYDQPLNGSPELPGPNDQISERSAKQLDTVLAETPHILGGWITKLHYEKMEYPIRHLWTHNALVSEAMKHYAEMQASGNGSSSDDLNRDKAQVLRNSEEARTGLIKCGSLDKSNLINIYPPIAQEAKGVCRATIPPFDENVNLAIIVVIDVEGDDPGREVQTIRRALLQLQIDIFNRDYQGRETWARATPPP